MLVQEVLSQPDAKSEQTFDTDSVPKTNKMLDGEAFKLQELDMVLAVVGTMKAGKSTTINAIVGVEVLPNRNAPMTAIPTLIRHTKGQVEPKLIFSNSIPIDKLMDQLRLLIDKSEFKSNLEELKQDKDLYELINKIRSKEKIGVEGYGQKAIFDFLKGLNDLVRISTAFGIEFPFEEYADINKLPIIDVEFTHLKEMDETKGRLILLDTPGPNEAGQNRLRPMLQDQLKKASAVLAVMDYTQLKSNADAEVRDDLSKIAEISNNRIYALVNKFDQKDRNGNTEEEVKKLVASLTNNMIPIEYIFPVSSKYAYLSNCARHAMKLTESLPKTAWAEDFAQLANLDEHELTDKDEVNKSIEKFWKRSNFSLPLENVIKVAYEQAALMALKSAVDKIGDVSTKIHTYLSLKEEGLKMEVGKLKKLIGEISQDIENVASCEKYASSKLSEHLNRLHTELDQITKDIVNKTKSDVNVSLGAAKKEMNKQEIENKNETLEGDFTGGLASLFSRLKKKSNPEGIHPDLQKYSLGEDVISFKSKKSAMAFVSDVEGVVQANITEANKMIEEAFEQMLARFDTDFTNIIVTDAQKTLDVLSNRLRKDGIGDLRLKLPSNRSFKLEGGAVAVMADIIEEKVETRTRRVKQEGAWASFKGFFNDDWNHDDVEYEVKIPVVSVEKIRANRIEAVDDYFKKISSDISERVKKPLTTATTDFFTEFRKIVEEIRGDLSNAMDTQKKGQKVQDQILEKIRIIKKPVPNLLAQSDALKNEFV